MTISDATGTSLGESVEARFFADVDSDLDGFAARYAMSADDLVTYADAHAPGSTTSDPVATRERILGNNPFPLRIPADEAGFAWGSFVNDTGRELTLASVVTQINDHPWPNPEPHASARQLWGYAVNAGFRSSALHGRSGSDQRGFEGDPSTAPVPNGATVRFPLVRMGAASNVCAANGCTSIATPKPAWIAAHDAELLVLEHLGARLFAYRDLLDQVQRHAVQQHARIDFIIEYLRRLGADLQRIRQPDAGVTALRDEFLSLKQTAFTAMVEPGPAAHRPMWMETHRSVARELALRLRNPRFRGWHEQILDHWQELGLDARYMGGLCAQAAMVTDELGYSDTDEAHAIIDAITPLLQGQAPSVESALTSWVRRWGSLVTATLGDMPGPAGLAGAVMKVHVLRVVISNNPAVFAGVRDGWLGALTSRLSAEQQTAFRTAMAAENTLERVPRMRAVYGGTVGGASAIVAAFALYGFYITWNDPRARSDLLSRATRGVAVASSAGMALSGGLVLLSAPAELFSTGFQQTLGKISRGAGTTLTYYLSVLAFVQGILQIVDGVQRGDRIAIMTGVLTALGGLATIAGVALAIPGLEALGAVLATIATLIGILQSLSGSPSAQQLLVEVLRRFAEDPITITNTHNENVPLRGFQGVALFSYVVNQEHRTELQTAYTHARDALLGWSGARLERTDDNVTWLTRNGLGDIINQLTQDAVLRSPGTEHPGGLGDDAAAVGP